MAQIFPKWTNQILKVVLAVAGAGLVFVVFVFWFWFSPWNLDVGYEPVQPLPFSHKTHAGVMGLDCRYCHTGVDKSSVAGVPPTQTCMNCHHDIKKESLKLRGVHESWQTGNPIPWVRVHKLPDYTYFDHSAHVIVGVGCIECHGRIDQMERVRTVKPFSMAWCLECHKDAAGKLRPADQVTNMTWKPSHDWMKLAKRKASKLNPPVESCSGCHR